jgi:DNA-binding transcriptional ArsR family regulator
MRELAHPDTADIRLTDVMHALSDPVRLAAVRQLAVTSERHCGALHEGGVAASTMTHHLRVLREAGVTRTHVVGRERLVSLRREDLAVRFPGLLDAVLTAGQSEDLRVR